VSKIIPNAHDQPILCIAFNKQRKELFSGAQDGLIKARPAVCHIPTNIRQDVRNPRLSSHLASYDTAGEQCLQALLQGVGRGLGKIFADDGVPQRVGDGPDVLPQLQIFAQLLGRGFIHSFPFPLNLSRGLHTKTPYTPYTPPNTPCTRATQPLSAPPIPKKTLQLS